MIDLLWSGKNWLCGAEVWSKSSVGSGTRSMASKRFFGLLTDPRPRRRGGEAMAAYRRSIGRVLPPALRPPRPFLPLLSTPLRPLWLPRRLSFPWRGLAIAVSAALPGVEFF